MFKKKEKAENVEVVKPKKKEKAKKEKKPSQVKKRNAKFKKVDIRDAIPFSYDKAKQMFVDNDGNYIMMVRTVGTNIFGFKESDQRAFVEALSRCFTSSIGKGQIYSYQIGADVDGYLSDFQFFKDNLDLSTEEGIIQYNILDRAQKRLKFTTLTKELVDRCFVFILKDNDIARLEQRCQEIVNVLHSYQRTSILDFTDTLLILYNYYHPIQSKLFDYLHKEVDDIMDFLCPTRIGMVDVGFKQCVELDGMYCRTKYIRDYKKAPEFALMSYLATAGDIDFSFHFMPAESDAITKVMDQELKNLTKNYDKAKDASQKTSIESKARETQAMIDQVVADGDTPYYFSVFVRIKGESLQIVNEISKELDNAFARFGVRFNDGVFEPLEMFNCSAPICHDVPDRFYKATTIDTLGYMYPFVFEALYDSTHYRKNVNYPPVYLGNTLQTNGVVFYDNFVRKDDRSNSNEFIVGQSGKGKTYFLMWLIQSRFSIGYKQYLIDVEGKELNKLTYHLGGVNIDCTNGDNGRINPLQIRMIIPDADTGDGKVPLEDIRPLDSHLRFLRSFLNAYKGNSDEIGILHSNLIEKAITTVFKDRGITSETNAKYILDNFKNEDYPIFSDVYDQLENEMNDLMKGTVLDTEEIRRYKICLAFLEPLAYGADANLFNGHTNVDLSRKVINFNLSALQDNTESRTLGTMYFNVISYIWTDIISDSSNTRKQLYADEFSVIMQPYFMDVMVYFQTIIKRIRKRYGGLTTATQEIKDVLKDSVREQGESIIENSAYQFYFGLGTEGIAYIKNSNLIPESEREFVQFANIGECYAKFGTNTAMRVLIQADDETGDVFRRIKDDSK